MHPSALEFGKKFFDTYCKNPKGFVVADIGSQNVNGSLKDVCPPEVEYIGIDFCPGNGVDVILNDPYKLPFDDGSVDIVVCSSVFEHSQFFWLLYLEIMRILKPAGLFYLNVPSNGYIHRYPVDCWRFYPDSGLALVGWAERNGYSPALLESFTGEKDCLSIENDAWNDFVAVFVKDIRYREEYKGRIIQSIDKYANAFRDDGVIDIKANTFTDDFLIIREKNSEIANLNKSLVDSDENLAELTAENANLKLVVNELNRKVDKLYKSTSWQITKPLRSINNLYAKLLHKFDI